MPQVCCGLKPPDEEVDGHLEKKKDLGSSGDKKEAQAMEFSKSWENYAYLLFDPYELMAPTSFPFPPIIGAYAEWDMCKGIEDTIYEESLPFNLQIRSFSGGMQELEQWVEDKPYFQQCPLRFPTKADIVEFYDHVVRYKAIQALWATNPKVYERKPHEKKNEGPPHPSDERPSS